jgi:hypothetical protein
MKTFLICLGLCCAFVDNAVCADEKPSLSPEQQDDLREIFSYNYVPVGNGFDDLMAAYDAIDLESTSIATLSRDAAEKPRLLRIALAKNALARHRIRAGLKRGIARPFAPADIPTSAKMRRLADTLHLESEVALLDENLSVAANSLLDAVELGVATANGGAWSETVSAIGIESIARTQFEQLVPKFDIAMLQAAAKRLKIIEERRVPLLDLWRNEQQVWLSFIREDEALPNEKFLRKEGFTAAQRAQILKLTRGELIYHASKRYETLMRRANWNYREFRDTPLRSFDPYTDKYAPGLTPSFYLFAYRRAQTQNILLRHALELEAFRRQNGVYPATFQTEVDPFDGDKKLIYRFVDEAKPLLYSIGPDTKDDSGTAISTLETNKTTGVKTITKRLLDNSSGDILAPIF